MKVTLYHRAPATHVQTFMAEGPAVKKYRGIGIAGSKMTRHCHKISFSLANPAVNIATDLYEATL